jgi:hypothetical protein
MKHQSACAELGLRGLAETQSQERDRKDGLRLLLTVARKEQRRLCAEGSRIC